MNNKFPTAKERRKMAVFKAEIENEELIKVAERFVNYEILPAILETDSTGVNIQLPTEAYDNFEEFRRLCIKFIPDDYIVEIGHDGAGMYNTLAVYW